MFLECRIGKARTADGSREQFPVPRTLTVLLKIGSTVGSAVRTLRNNCVKTSLCLFMRPPEKKAGYQPSKETA